MPVKEFLVNSETGERLSTNGDEFFVTHYKPLGIPRTAKNILLSVEQAELFWVSPNILTGVNDLFKIVDANAGGALDTGVAPQTYNLVFPQGLYDITTFNTTLIQLQEDAGMISSLYSPPRPFITASYNISSGKVILIANYTSLSIDFTIAQTPREILGYDSQTLGPSTQVPTNWTADNLAVFNTITSFLLHTDLVENGLQLNKELFQIVAQVLINNTVGKQIRYQPFNSSVVDASKLAGNLNRTWKFWITDQNSDPVNLQGEAWSMRIRITWEE